MSRKAEVSEHSFKYLSNLAKAYKCAVGIIIGQAIDKDFIVIHLARTVACQTINNGKSMVHLTNICDISEKLVNRHINDVYQMLPGGMQVLGIFIVSDEDVFHPFHTKLTKLFNNTNKDCCWCDPDFMSMEEYYSYSYSDEKMIMHYSGKTQKCLIKSYKAIKSGQTQDITLKLINKPNKWVRFDFTYNIDYYYYLLGKSEEQKSKSKTPVRFTYMKLVLIIIKLHLKALIFLYDNEFKSDDEQISSLRSSKDQGKNAIDEDSENKPVQITILEQCSSDLKLNTSSTNEKKIVPRIVYRNINIVGGLVCRIWLNPKLTIANVRTAICEEIMRSLSSRIKTHLYSLTEEEVIGGCSTVNVLPRRALVTLPTENEISVTAYIFPGEELMFGVNDICTELLDIGQENMPLEVFEVEKETDIQEHTKNVTESEVRIDDETENDYPMLCTCCFILCCLIILTIALGIHHFYGN